MELPATIRRRIQAAMPLLVPSRPISAPCHLPTLSSAALTSLQPSTPSPGPHQRIIPSRASNSSSGRSKSLASQDLDMEIDLWTLLEDGTSSAPSMSSGSNMGGTSGDHSNLKACSWLKGTVRVQRTDLTYIGALDEDSWPCTIILTMEHWQPQERSCELHFHTNAMGYIIFCLGKISQLLTFCFGIVSEKKLAVMPLAGPSLLSNTPKLPCCCFAVYICDIYFFINEMSKMS